MYAEKEDEWLQDRTLVGHPPTGSPLGAPPHALIWRWAGLWRAKWLRGIVLTRCSIAHLTRIAERADRCREKLRGRFGLLRARCADKSE